MDPNTTLKLIAEHLEDGCLVAARESAIDLGNWLNLGGFEPDWSKYEKAEAYFDKLVDQKSIVLR